MVEFKKISEEGSIKFYEFNGIFNGVFTIDSKDNKINFVRAAEDQEYNSFIFFVAKKYLADKFPDSYLYAAG